MIENPILNSPFEEPSRHFELVDGKFTENIIAGRRRSSYLIPVARPKGVGRSSQLLLPGQQDEEVKPNPFVNEVRSLVRVWREAGYPGITQVTRTLLDYWKNPKRANRLFFAQIEAMETAIYLTEYAPANKPAIINHLDSINRDENEALPRRAFKMATGTGKTVVMSMLIAWHVLNKANDPQDKRFSDAFLIVTPGIPIRDRLRVLRPQEPQESNYYLQRDIVPPDMRERLLAARIVITNRHAFQLRDTLEAPALNKVILGGGIQETPNMMVRRVLRELGNKKNIIVMNDEAHHCYIARETDQETGEEAKAARSWLEGLRHVKDKVGIRSVYDLSATPFYLSSSGRVEGTLFEWVVSDFDLTDAIESGLVKIPHTPVSDDTASEVPKYRAIWAYVKDDLKRLKKTRKEDDKTPPLIPGTLEGALKSLYNDYERAYTSHLERGGVPPALVVVCDDTRTSKLVSDWISGYDGFDGPVAGSLPLFTNVADGRWLDRPRTFLIDSNQLDNGEISDSFRKAAEHELAEFRKAYRRRTGRDDIDDVTIMREVLNSVGRKGQLGENIRCVVSVMMLSEGWDANNVTHILGIRAFTTRLLCEQVIGRGLRRMSYRVVETPEGERYAPEYAEIYGVPFDFYPAQAGRGQATVQPTTVVEALRERQELHEITFPIIVGYRRHSRPATLTVTWPKNRFEVSRRQFDVAQETVMAPYVGQEKTIDYNPDRRRATLAFELAKTVMERHFTTTDGGEESWYFPQVLRLVQEWTEHQALFENDEAIQLLDVAVVRNAAADDIGTSIDRSAYGLSVLRAEARRWDPVGTSSRVHFETTKDVIATTKSPVNYVVCDSSWEADAAKILETADGVKSYVKNQGLGFVIPYVFEAQTRSYFPDFIIKWEDQHGKVNVILEVTGENLEEKRAKGDAARNRWVKAVNNTGTWGIWAYAEVHDLADTIAIIVDAIKNVRANMIQAEKVAI